MKLKDIIKNCGVTGIKGSPEMEILGMTNDSRKVLPGSLFVAVTGCGNDGRAHIADALKAGAAAVMCEGGCEAGETVSVDVADSRLAVAMAADNFYGHPSGRLKLVGITGTNGKTTTVTLLYNMFRSLGHECGLLSTIANYVGDKMVETSNTTSDPVTINSLLSDMLKAGCEYCFMEVSSIGVDQQRTAGLEFKAGIFSNLTHDHLDYHGTFAKYLRCKQRFFDALPEDAVAITNADDRNGMIMVQNTKARVVTYSCRSIADHRCKVMEESLEGMLLNIDGTEVWTRLCGAHNACNLLAIYSTAVELGIPVDKALIALSTLTPAKGRLEVIPGPDGRNIVIDYAHTPDALENVLKTLRDVEPKSELVCLFGCGGDRDRGKRPEMGAVAGKLADRIFLTSDNSRSERTEDIIEDIKAGIGTGAASKVICIPDRKEAIRAAIMLSSKGATILLAGKGHETYQIIGGEKRHFDEREIVEEVIKSLV